MVGIKDLGVLLKSMNPKISGKNYVFCTIGEREFESMNLNSLLVFREKEGVTVVIKEDEAKKNNLDFSDKWDLITLNVHSDLNAVGLLAAVSGELAKHKISINVVSAYYHDHIFVHANKSKRALGVLKKIGAV